MSERRSPRQRDTFSELTLLAQPGSGLAKLHRVMRDRIATHHYNRVVLNFLQPDGTVEAFTVYPGNGDPEKYKQRMDLLNWSEH